MVACGCDRRRGWLGAISHGFVSMSLVKETRNRPFMKRTAVLLALFAAALIASVLILCWPSGYMASRDIGCGKVNSERGKNICNALSASMEWTWMGHAIISPGWRVTWTGLGHVYCREKITDADLPVLEMLIRGPDWRLKDGAIFNPENLDYILKNGC
jgi:hypothetical protein